MEENKRKTNDLYEPLLSETEPEIKKQNKVILNQNQETKIEIKPQEAVSAPVIDNVKPAIVENQGETEKKLSVQEKRGLIAQRKAEKNRNIFSNLAKKFKKITSEYKEDKLLTAEAKKEKEENEKRARDEWVKRKTDEKLREMELKKNLKATLKKQKEEEKLAKKKQKEEERAAKKKQKEEERAAKKKQKEEERKEKKETLKAELKLEVAKIKAREKRFCKAMSGFGKEVAYGFTKEGFKEQLHINAHAKFKPSTFGLPVGVPVLNIVAIPVAAILNVIAFLQLSFIKGCANLALKLFGIPKKTEEEMVELRRKRNQRRLENIGCFIQKGKEWAKVNKVTDDDLIPEEIADNPKLKKNAADKGLKPMIGVTAVNGKDNSVISSTSKNRGQSGIVRD